MNLTSAGLLALAVATVSGCVPEQIGVEAGAGPVGRLRTVAEVGRTDGLGSRPAALAAVPDPAWQPLVLPAAVAWQRLDQPLEAAPDAPAVVQGGVSAKDSDPEVRRALLQLRRDAAGARASGLGPSSAALAAVGFALDQVGDPYVWGGTGPDAYDCSGLTSTAWAAAGLRIPRVSRDQYAAAGTHVGITDLLPGDLVFFATASWDPGVVHHVGMYVGRGLMVDAPRPGLTVRVEPVWPASYVGAVRPSPATRRPSTTTPRDAARRTTRPDGTPAANPGPSRRPTAPAGPASAAEPSSTSRPPTSTQSGTSASVPTASAAPSTSTTTAPSTSTTTAPTFDPSTTPASPDPTATP